MLNVVLTTKKSKSKIVERFIRSRGIEKFIPVFESDLLFDTLLTTDTCNLHIFDFIFDLGTINTIRDFRDKINTLNVYVSNIESAKAYLALTDNVFIIPDVYDIFSWFWDSEACRASNVMGFNAMNYDFCKVINPATTGKTRSISVDIGMEPVPLQYITADGRAVKTEGQQLVLKCKAKNKSLDLRALATRNQEEVYAHKQRSLADLPARPMPVEETTTAQHKQSINGAMFAEVKQVEEVPDEITEEKETIEAPPIVIDDRRGSETTFRDLFKKNKKEKPAKKPKRNIDAGSYVSFGNFVGGTQSADYSANEMNVDEIVSNTHIIEERYDSIAAYCLAHKYLTIEDHDKLAEGLELDKNISKDDQWANKALAGGFITEEQLIEATTAVKNIGVLTWKELEEMEPDFSTFSIDKCKKFRFFKLKDSDPTADRVTLVYSATLASLNPELYRMYDNPIPKVTLDVYIDRKLEEYA